YLASIVMAGGALRRLASEEQKARWLQPLIEGGIGALAFSEPQSRYRLNDVQLMASRDSDHYLLNGRKAVVLAGDYADTLVVSARTSGSATDEAGISLFVLDASSEGIRRNGYPTVDGHRAAEIEFSAVSVPANQRLGAEGEALAVLRQVIDEATLAVCAEAVGIMQTLHDKTLEYTRSRVQFGRPIASFQALQHRMVDTFMACEQTRSLLFWATMTAVDEGSEASAQAISALKYQVGTAGRRVGEEAVQIHGGMGVTWELDVAHYFKRLTAINMLFGNADYHLGRIEI
ncbi:MAG: pimeloyl-CoA dehydrogenase small subunit, partial [Xanthomonadales bacterium]|nr:pimeloyl-CoA dehydrogenase small subunit [Xanthomonadales bacterium]